MKIQLIEYNHLSQLVHFQLQCYSEYNGFYVDIELLQWVELWWIWHFLHWMDQSIDNNHTNHHMDISLIKHRFAFHLFITYILYLPCKISWIGRIKGWCNCRWKFNWLHSSFAFCSSCTNDLWILRIVLFSCWFYTWFKKALYFTGSFTTITSPLSHNPIIDICLNCAILCFAFSNKLFSLVTLSLWISCWFCSEFILFFLKNMTSRKLVRPIKCEYLKTNRIQSKWLLKRNDKHIHNL